MPPTRKPANKRQNRVTTDIGVVTNTGETPKPPCRLRKTARLAWEGYWSSDVAGATDRADRALVDRWVKNVNRYDALMATADKQPVVSGSTGQPVANPLYSQALQLEKAIKADEQQMGIGPLNRVKLGLVIGQVHASLSDLNAEAEGGDDGDDDIRATIVAIERVD